jgi:predicted dehydrogenase
MIRIALIGAGNRGMEVYGELALKFPDEVEVVSVVEPLEYKRRECARRHTIPEELRFKNCIDFFEKDRLADAVIIANHDRDHYEPARRAALKGYDVLLEKPVAVDAAEIRELAGLSGQYPGRLFMVSHVLRYAPFFQELKRLVDGGAIGRIVSIQHNENIGYFHFAHSYVRGNWRKVSESSPLVLAKSCHDMDILQWLADSHCKRISAFGCNSYFNRKSAPDYAVPLCRDCAAADSCPYSVYKIYQDPAEWPGNVVAPSKTGEELDRRLKEEPYGRCVYYCDNDTIDHMSAAMEFENGVSAVFSMSAFTPDISRTIKLMGAQGEIRGDMLANEIEVTVFGGKAELIVPPVVEGGHGGGDLGLFREFIACMKDRGRTCPTTMETSLEGHLMALAAEESRTTGRTVAVEL